jgi:hypothetical protein
VGASLSLLVTNRNFQQVSGTADAQRCALEYNVLEYNVLYHCARANYLSVDLGRF